jgi:signal transduction histidine kinase
MLAGAAIYVDIRNEAEFVLPDAARDHVYRIAQEALTNAVKADLLQQILK